MDNFFSYSTTSYSAPPLSEEPYSSCYSSAFPQTSYTTESSSNASGGQHIHIDPDEQVLPPAASSIPKKRDGIRRKVVKETRHGHHPVYRGVRRRNPDKWVSEVREPNKESRIWLGTFPTAEMAARAHDVATIALRGPDACLNFADSAWTLPLAASSNAKDIQKAAAEAAQAFRPPDDDIINAVDTTTIQADETTLELQQNHAVSSYMDEEALFGTHEYINNMAQGMMLPPPHFGQADVYYGNADMDDLSLWNF